MTHGLPDELAKLYSLAGIRRNADRMIEDAVAKALAAGYTADRIDEILTTRDYPPPGADPKWLKGWDAAKGGEAPPKDVEAFMGFQAWLTRHG